MTVTPIEKPPPGGFSIEQVSSRTGEQEKEADLRRTVNVRGWTGRLTCGLLITCSPDPRGISLAFMFENLQVYQKAADLADSVAALTESFPRGDYFLVDQLNHAALSVATNLAEGNGRFHRSRLEELLHHRPRLGPGMCAAAASRQVASIH